MSKILTVAILGAGSRGAETYGRFFKVRDDMFKILSICELKKERLERYKKNLKLMSLYVLKMKKNSLKKKELIY